MQKSLLIIDVQNDYFPGGKMELPGMQQAAENCQMMLNSCRDAGVFIVHIQHIMESEEAPFFVVNSNGSNIHKLVSPQKNEIHYTKHYPNAFRGTPLHTTLQSLKVSHLIICGAMSHMCIDTSVRAAFDLGYHCQVASDACATKPLEFEGEVIGAAQVHGAYMAGLGTAFATVKKSKELAQELKHTT